MSSAPTPNGAASNVLIVEDEIALQNVYREQLERVGEYAVSVASDGVEALEVIETESPDLVFLNRNLHHLDGLEVAERARQQDPNLPIVIISGYDGSNEIDDTLVDDYLVKPVSADTLVRAAGEYITDQPAEPDAELEQ